MRRFRWAGSWLLLVGLIVLALWLERQNIGTEEIDAASGTAIQVIDGDSLRFGGREIRLAGIDAPEYRQTCTDEAGRNWACGREARAALERLVSGPGFRCSTASEDRYGRSLSHCSTAAGDVAKSMARLGWAVGARDARFVEPQAEIAGARRARRGMWRGPHQHPADWRKANPR